MNLANRVQSSNLRPLLGALAVLLATQCLAASPVEILEANARATVTGKPHGAEVTIDYQIEGQGLAGSAKLRYDSTSGAFERSETLGPISDGVGFDGKQAWQRDWSQATVFEAGGDRRQLAVNDAYRLANRWWLPEFGGASVNPLAEQHDGGRSYQVLSVTPRGGKRFEAWFDAETHLLARTIEAQQYSTVTTRFDEWRRHEGHVVPARVIVDPGTGADQRETLTVVKVSFGAQRSASTYARPPSRASDFKVRNGSGRTTIPFKLLNNHIYADVVVNGQGPFLFLFDTGGHDLLMPATAAALHLDATGHVAGTGAGEGSADTAFAPGLLLKIGDLELSDQLLGVVPDSSISTAGVDQQGVIGFELFRRLVTTIDYAASTLTFTDPSKFKPSPDLGTPVHFDFYDHIPQVTGRLDGHPARFDIDSGSRAEITVTKPYAQSLHLRDVYPKGVVAIDGWGVGGKSVSYVTRLRELTMGSVVVDDVVAGFATQDRGTFSDANYDGNVGSGLLKRFVVTLDYEHQLMYLKPRVAPVPDTKTFDRSGLWMNWSPVGFEIMDVASGSAGAAAGLAIGDVITRVDGTAATSIQLSDLRMRLRNPDIKAVDLLISRDGSERSVILALHDQV